MCISQPILYQNLKKKSTSIPSIHTVKKFKRFSRPQPGCHWLNSPWAGIFPPRESLVSDIPAGDGKMANLFLQCRQFGYGRKNSQTTVPLTIRGAGCQREMSYNPLYLYPTFYCCLPIKWNGDFRFHLWVPLWCWNIYMTKRQLRRKENYRIFCLK
jgi:hypothetical protein